MPVFIGTSGDDSLTGTIGDDVIAGFDGRDSLFDGGGGADELIGGRGDDFYYVSNRLTTIVEYDGEGTDWIYTSSTVYVLPDRVENLVYNDQVNNFRFVGIGNAGDNFLRGGTASDSLAGGAGNDIINGEIGAANELIGGDGDDSYFSLAAGDTIVEYAGGGFDQVVTNLSAFSLPANVEGVSFSGSGRAVGTGNQLDNFLQFGNGFGSLAGLDGDDTLQGGRGGASEMIGGAGNDRFYIVNSGDSVVEYAGDGYDIVEIHAIFTTITAYTLPANIEELRFFAAFGMPAANLVGVGNDGDNRLTGLDGNDTLSGLGGADILDGGAGMDLLIGGSGADRFLYFGIPASLDRLIDFEPGIDKIVISGVARTSTISYEAGTAASAFNTTLLYDPATGIVSYDFDGAGALAPAQIVQLNAGLTLSLADFAIG